VVLAVLQEIVRVLQRVQRERDGEPPLSGWVLDIVTAVLLFMVLGWQWLLLPGLVLEAIPGVGVVAGYWWLERLQF